MEEKVILTPRVASYLINNGCKLIRIKADRRNPTRSVFVFAFNEHFKELLTKYSQNKNNNQKGDS